MPACDKTRNKNIGRDAMGNWFRILAAAATMLKLIGREAVISSDAPDEAAAVDAAESA